MRIYEPLIGESSGDQHSFILLPYRSSKCVRRVHRKYAFAAVNRTHRLHKGTASELLDVVSPCLLTTARNSSEKRSLACRVTFVALLT